jgi:hypothetical protein
VHDLSIINTKGYKKLDDLDVALHLKILYNNWDEFSKIDSDKFTYKNKRLVKRISEIRNHTAHPNEKTISHYDDDVKDFEHFAEFLGTNINQASIELHRKLQEEDSKRMIALYELIDVKVWSPALESNILKPDIKISLRDTQNRLKKKTTSKEIYDFFYDALDARRGKEVYSNLKKAGLLAFEDIQDEFYSIYWTGKVNYCQ